MQCAKSEIYQQEMVYRCKSVIEMQLKQCQCWGYPVTQERKALDVAGQNMSLQLCLFCAAIAWKNSMVIPEILLNMLRHAESTISRVCSLADGPKVRRLKNKGCIWSALNSMAALSIVLARCWAAFSCSYWASGKDCLIRFHWARSSGVRSCSRLSVPSESLPKTSSSNCLTGCAESAACAGGASRGERDRWR